MNVGEAKGLIEKGVWATEAASPHFADWQRIETDRVREPLAVALTGLEFLLAQLGPSRRIAATIESKGALAAELFGQATDGTRNPDAKGMVSGAAQLHEYGTVQEELGNKLAEIIGIIHKGITTSQELLTQFDIIRDVAQISLQGAIETQESVLEQANRYREMLS
jgi:hypothetical protein